MASGITGPLTVVAAPNETAFGEFTDITDSTGGSAGTTLVAVTDTSASDQSSEINDNFATLAAQVALIMERIQ